MKKLLKNFDSPLMAFVFLLFAIAAFCFLAAGIQQVYIQFAPVIRFAMLVFGGAFFAAIIIVGYWVYKAFKK